MQGDGRVSFDEFKHAAETWECVKKWHLTSDNKKGKGFEAAVRSLFEDLDLDNEGQHAPAFYPADDPHQYRGETSDNAFGCVP